MMNEPGRSLWTGSITFGLVVLPVKMYTATGNHDLSFRQVHNADGGRIRYPRRCEACSTEVPYADVAKGYEGPDGTITVLTDGDLEGLPLASAKTINVTQFTDPADIDPLLLDKTYYLLPGTAGGGLYALVAEALHRTGLAGICTVAVRKRETVALLTETSGVLVLRLLLWEDEVKRIQAPEAPETSPALIEQALALIEVMTEKFDASAYSDHYAEALQSVVDAKLAGTPHPAAPPAGTEAASAIAITDLMAASVEAAKKARAKKEKTA